MKYQRTSVGLDVHARSVVAWAWTVRPARCSSAGCPRITTRPWNGSGRCRGGGGDVGGRADRPGIVSRNCCCGRGSSTPAGRHGPASTNCGCGCTPSPRLACNWPMRPRSTPCWPPWIAGTVWMPRSRRWPPRSLHPGSDPAGVPARGLDVDRVRAGHRDRGLGPPVRPVHRRLPWAGAHRVLLGHHPLPGRGHQRRQQPCPPTADRSRVASPNPVSAGARAAPTMGRGVARGPRGGRPRTGVCTPAG